MKKGIFRIITITLLAISVFAQGQSKVNPRAEWFTDARFGMFIHWGVYSGAEGIWKGEKLRDYNNYAEWIYYRNRIDREEYLTLLERFDWEAIDPEKWVVLAKKAGMKYVCITAKHHDGFALWDSKVSDYDVAEYTLPKRDIMKELAAACQKHDMKLGFYYSHWVDWEHPGAWDHTKEIYGISPEDYDQYWQEKVLPQMRELLTGYGKIDMIWFDMWKHHSETCVTKEQLLQLKGLIREIQPQCLVNSRLGLSIEEDSDIDYKTLGDNQLGSKKEEFAWQSPATVAHSWGFHALEEQWKSTSTLLHSLIGNVSLNGNMMLNIGPRANGDVPYEIENRLLDMGQWLAINGEAIYGCQAFDLVKDQHDWGRITSKVLPDGRTRLYLHLYNWPLNHQLPVTGIKETPNRAYMLADKQEADLAFEHKQVFTWIKLPGLQPDPYVSVVVLEYDGYPEIEDGLVAESVYGGYALKPGNTVRKEGNDEIIASAAQGWIPPHIMVDEKSSYTWRLYVEEPLSLNTDVSYSYQGESGKGKLSISSASNEISQELKASGLFVGEPNRGLKTPDFQSNRIGSLEFPSAGIYEITLEIKPAKEEPMDFLWLWLEK